MSLGGLVKWTYLQDNSDEYTADGTTDLVVNNVPVVNGRLYLVLFRSQIQLPDQGAGNTDQRWNLLLRVNDITVDRFCTVANTTDAVGTDTTETVTAVGRLYWTATATQATDDFEVYADNTSGADPSLTLQATPKARRYLAIFDVAA